MNKEEKICCERLWKTFQRIKRLITDVVLVFFQRSQRDLYCLQQIVHVNTGIQFMQMMQGMFTFEGL